MPNAQICTFLQVQKASKIWASNMCAKTFWVLNGPVFLNAKPLKIRTAKCSDLAWRHRSGSRNSDFRRPFEIWMLKVCKLEGIVNKSRPDFRLSNGAEIRTNISPDFSFFQISAFHWITSFVFPQPIGPSSMIGLLAAIASTILMSSDSLDLTLTNFNESLLTISIESSCSTVASASFIKCRPWMQTVRLTTSPHDTSVEVIIVLSEELLSKKWPSARASKLFSPDKRFRKTCSRFVSLQLARRPRHSTANHLDSLDRVGALDRSWSQGQSVWKNGSQLRKLRQHFKIVSSEMAEKKFVDFCNRHVRNPEKWTSGFQDKLVQIFVHF